MRSCLSSRPEIYILVTGGATNGPPFYVILQSLNVGQKEVALGVETQGRFLLCYEHTRQAKRRRQNDFN